MNTELNTLKNEHNAMKAQRNHATRHARMLSELGLIAIEETGEISLERVVNGLLQTHAPAGVKRTRVLLDPKLRLPVLKLKLIPLLFGRRPGRADLLTLGLNGSP